MGKRGPQPKERTARTIGAYCQLETADKVEEMARTRNRKPAFVAAECIRLGLSEFERLYPPVEAQETAPATSKKKSAKRARVGASAKKKAPGQRVPRRARQ